MSDARRFISIRSKYVEKNDGLSIYQYWVNDEIESTQQSAIDLTDCAWSIVNDEDDDFALSAIFCIACAGSNKDFLELCSLLSRTSLVVEWHYALEYMIVRLNIDDSIIPGEHRQRAQKCPICKEKVEVSPRYPKYICQKCLSGQIEIEEKIVKLSKLHMYYGSCSVKCKVNGHLCEAHEAHFGGTVVQHLD